MADKQEIEAKTAKVEDSTNTKKESDNWFVRGIIGLFGLMVLGSITFSTVVIYNGTDALIFKIALIPQALFALVLAFVAFSKILK